VKTDWIYTRFAYTTNSTTMTPGVAGALAVPLSYAQNTRRLAPFGPTGVAPAAGVWVGWEAIPEGSKQQCFEVDGELMLIPNTWNVGNSFLMGWRLMYGEQQSSTADQFLDPEYHMFDAAAAPNTSAAQWANAGYMKEGYFNISNIAGTAITSSGAWKVPIKWKSRRGVTLNNAFSVFLYLESAIGSINMRIIPRLRSRWRVE